VPESVSIPALSVPSIDPALALPPVTLPLPPITLPDLPVPLTPLLPKLP
jgi:hypothetical protein